VTGGCREEMWRQLICRNALKHASTCSDNAALPLCCFALHPSLFTATHSARFRLPQTMDVQLSLRVLRAALHPFLSLIREASVLHHFIITFEISTDHCMRMHLTWLDRAYPVPTSTSNCPGTGFPRVSHRVGLRVYDPGSIPSSLTHRLVRTRLSAHNASRRRYRSQFP
jgi:hypothetical protein